MFYFVADRDYMNEARIIKTRRPNLKIRQYRTAAILKNIFLAIIP